MLLAGCETTSTPYAPVRDVRYQALGAEPFWSLAIGDDRIVLRTAQASVDGLDARATAAWPRTLPRTVDGVRTWQSAAGGSTITVESRPGPCETEGEDLFEDDVRVRGSGRSS